MPLVRFAHSWHSFMTTRISRKIFYDHRHNIVNSRFATLATGCSGIVHTQKSPAGKNQSIVGNPYLPIGGHESQSRSRLCQTDIILAQNTIVLDFQILIPILISKSNSLTLLPFKIKAIDDF